MRDFQLPGRSVVYGVNGMCATSHPLAAKVAVDLLTEGCTAVDAGVAAAFVLGLCEPGMTGIGGDCFAIYASPRGDVVGLNGSGRAPAAIDAEALRAKGPEIDRGSADAVTIPGAVAGLCRLALDHGRCDVARLLAPAILYAEEGVPVAPRAAFDLARAHETLTGAARRHHLKSDGALFDAGDVWRAPAQAQAFKAIAQHGAKGFYEGPVAEDMVRSLRAAGGVHTLDDFAAVTPEYVTPISTTYRGYDVLELPPNGQGATALLMLDMLARHDLTALDPLGAERAHLEAEIAKLAYEARNRFISEPETIRDGLERMRDPNTADSLCALVDPERARPATDPTDHVYPSEPHRDTVYLCVVDQDGGALSLIYSIFGTFGSGLASEDYGILFQNRGAGFTLRPGHRNEIAPGKRPLHTIIPGLLRCGERIVAPFGVMGGQYQPAGHARLLTNLLDYGMDVQTGLDAARSFPEPGGPETGLELESGYAESVAAALAAKGHEIMRDDTPIGGGQAIWIDHERGVLAGGSDPRKDGCALGF